MSSGKCFISPSIYFAFINFFRHFRLSYYPHTLHNFSALLKETFGDGAEHSVFADFKPVKEEDNPAFYIHVIKKK